MLKELIKIDAEKCDGCGLCVEACHENALEIVEEGGKKTAKLVRELNCDGIGNCLPACPQGAIQKIPAENAAGETAAWGNAIGRDDAGKNAAGEAAREVLSGASVNGSSGAFDAGGASGALEEGPRSWPLQLKLVSEGAGFFKGADVLVAADCTAFSYPRFYPEFIGGRVVLTGCPKLDGADYSKKLEQIFSKSPVKSLTLAIMEVPCCGGLLWMLKNAKEKAGLKIPVRVVTISIEGKLLAEETL